MKRTVFPKVIAGVFASAFAVTLLAAGSLALTSGAARADDDYCNVPKSEWKTTDALKAKLIADGWDVRKIKEDEGCFEVYAITPDGKKIEAYFNPASFEIVKQDKED
ncbi:PepSY domain-containing protein [Thalassospira profundimaris]|uniref:Signal peptide protein n=1 Tax=Thalassospira profundimaris TaxID=502049 RepID=A0A367WM71_9PROT|nr:PepSY domain-containing protein [Thalassospira profundimaris]RCK42545.1 signal peptide protein [Thalassospira profundimaris]